MSYEAAQEYFVDRMERIRADKGLTKKEFSELLGIPKSSYDYYTNKGGMPTLYSVMLMADGLGLTLDHLLGIKGGKKK